MTLIDDLKAAEQRAAGPVCGACAWVRDARDMPLEEKREVIAAMEGNIGVTKLAAILRKHGIPVGRRALERHRAHLGEARDRGDQ